MHNADGVLLIGSLRDWTLPIGSERGGGGPSAAVKREAHLHHVHDASALHCAKGALPHPAPANSGVRSALRGGELKNTARAPRRIFPSVVASIVAPALYLRHCCTCAVPA
eukprot:9503392-Pyramimonas_sp.AAC.2